MDFVLPVIVPIVLPVIDWHKFVVETNAAILRSPTRTLDSHGMPVGSLQSFVASIGGFISEKNDPHNFVQSCSHALKHLHFTFLCYTVPNLSNDIAINTELVSTLADDRTFLLSGTLLEFKQSIISCLIIESTFDLRLFFNCLYTFFNSIELGMIFQRYRVEMLPDGTFILR